MPYIITTKEPERWLGSQPYGSPGESYLPARTRSRAVATIFEARDLAAQAAMHAGSAEPKAESQAEAISESGGTVGPFPDGTVIEIEHVLVGDLVKAGGSYPGGVYRWANLSNDQVIAAYNSRPGHP